MSTAHPSKGLGVSLHGAHRSCVLGQTRVPLDKVRAS